MRRLPAILFAAALAGCSHPYADFHLPDPGPPEPGHYVWQALPDPVLPRGEPAAWDGTDTLNPSVVRFQNGLWNLYSGYDGKTWSTGVAVSTDGRQWRRRGRVISPDAGNGAALVTGGTIWYWYQSGARPEIFLSRSRDGVAFTGEPQPQLTRGPYGAWDEMAVADPYVVEAGGQLYLYYLGEDSSRRQQLGVAASGVGQPWTRLRGNPILRLGENGAFDENGLGEPAVWAAHGHYWMLYTGRDRREVRRMGLARSRDGIHWDRTSLVISHDQPWAAKVVCDPTVLVDGDRVRVWFGGGNVAHPAENINGQIGYGELRFQRP